MIVFTEGADLWKEWTESSWVCLPTTVHRMMHCDRTTVLTDLEMQTRCPLLYCSNESRTPLSIY